MRAFALHTLWRADSHETIHLLASRFAPAGAVALFWEGFAVAHQIDPITPDFTPMWNGRYLKQHLDTNRFVSQRMLTTAAFRAVPDVVSYPIAGSFVRYLIDRFGYGRVKELLRRAHPSQKDAAVRETFALAGRQTDECPRCIETRLGARMTT